MVKCHTRPSQANAGGIVSKEAPIDFGVFFVDMVISQQMQRAVNRQVIEARANATNKGAFLEPGDNTT